jgi:hypothetical protein
MYKRAGGGNKKPQMSEYERFVAFQECASQRLGRDIVQMVFKTMFSKQELEDILWEYAMKVYDTAIDMETQLDNIKSRAKEAERQARIIRDHYGLGSEQYKQALKSVDDLRREFQDTRADSLARIQSFREKALAVKAQILLL